MRSRSASTPRASGGTGSTACRTNTSQRLPRGGARDRGGRVIVAHLGSGASMCALAGRPQRRKHDGLHRARRACRWARGRARSIRRRALPHRPKGHEPAAQVQDLLYRECGLKGLSGISNDVRELQASPIPRARLAVDYFVYRVGLHAGMLAAALGGLDAFVFTAGIGENSPAIRARIAEKLAWLGAVLDPQANAAATADLAAGEPGRALRRADRRGADDRTAYHSVAARTQRRESNRRKTCRMTRATRRTQEVLLLTRRRSLYLG